MNPAIAPTLPAATASAGAIMPASRVLRAYLIEAKYESLRMLRSPAFGIPFLGIPVALYLLFGVLLFGDAVAKDPKAGWFMFLGFAIFGVMGPGMFGFGITVAIEREQGMLKLKRALPMPAAASILAKMLMSMLFVAIVMATMDAAAPIGHLHMTAIQMLSLAAVCIPGSLPFCALGFFIGSLASGKAAPGFVNVLYLPMIYLSNILIPLPKSMVWVSRISPAYHLEQLAIASLGAPSEGSVGLHIAVLAGITLAFSTFAIRRLSRVG
jgi:ABC-2 type transport system permease protein